MSKKLKNKFTCLKNHGLFQCLCLFTCVILFTCESEEQIPDVSDIKAEVNIIRFDQAFQQIDTLEAMASLQALEEKYPKFTPLFFSRILPLSASNAQDQKSLLADSVNKYLKDEFVQSLYDTVQIVFPNLEDEKTELLQSLQYLKYYFPQTGSYNVYAFISEFGFQTFIMNDEDGKEGLGLGLDMFLGAEYPYKSLVIKNASFSDYITRTFNKDHIVKKLLDAIIADLIPDTNGERLLDKIINTGKHQYILDKAMPFTSDTIKWEYTSAQMAWVNDNEANIYVHILGEDLLYESKTKKIKSLIDLSPNSKGMPAEAPGRTANFIGFKIVDKFMDRTGISIDSLLNITDAQMILDQSRYKPLNR